jgi:nucleoside-diphosphate-sugar epimerase
MSELHVIFGTGPLGMAVVDELVANGQSVRVANRSGEATVPAGVEVLAGDASDPDFARKAAEGAAVIYNMLNPPYDKWPELFPPLQAGVLEGATAAGAKLVVMENLYMYGDTGGKPLTEDMPYSAHTKKGGVRARMSRDLMDAHEKGRVQVAIGRASDYFGPRATWQSMLGERLIPAALEGKAAQVIGNPDLPHTFSYIPDIGKALVTLGTHDKALGQAWHIPNAPTKTTRELIQMVYAETGHPPKIQVAPKLILRAMGLFNPGIRELMEMMYEFEQPFIVDHSKFEAAFGNHATSLETAIHDTVQWYRDHPST